MVSRNARIRRLHHSADCDDGGQAMIRLSGQLDDKGVTGTAGVAALVTLLPVAGFFTTGTSAKIPMGAPISEFGDEDVALAFATTAPAPLVVPAQPVPLRWSQLRLPRRRKPFNLRAWSRNNDKRASAVTPDEERWAEALAVERQHGKDGPRFIAERVGELALAGDMKGVQRWEEIATRLDQLRFGSMSKRPS